jgi:hypothetical protein
METRLAARLMRRPSTEGTDRRRSANPLEAFVPLALGVLLVFATLVVVGRPA